MAEKKSRGRAPGPGIPFRIQTPKQRSVVALVRALGSFNYSNDATYIAGRFMSYDTIVHLNMKLLAGVLEFISRYDVISQLGDQKCDSLDLKKINELSPQNITDLLLEVLPKTENQEQEKKRRVDFIRYLFFAITVLKCSENVGDNSNEINELLKSS